MFATVVNLGWKIIEGFNVMNVTQQDDPIMVVLVYNKTVDYPIIIIKSLAMKGAYTCCNTNISNIFSYNAHDNIVNYTTKYDNNNNNICLYCSGKKNQNSGQLISSIIAGVFLYVMS